MDFPAARKLAFKLDAFRSFENMNISRVIWFSTFKWQDCVRCGVLPIFNLLLQVSSCRRRQYKRGKSFQGDECLQNFTIISMPQPAFECACRMSWTSNCIDAILRGANGKSQTSRRHVEYRLGVAADLPWNCSRQHTYGETISGVWLNRSSTMLSNLLTVTLDRV